MGSAYQQLLDHMAAIMDLQSAAGLLAWDEQTHMPPAGAATRARQKALLQQEIHRRLTDPVLGELVERSEVEVGDADPDAEPVAMVRVARRHHDQATRMPPALVRELSLASSEGFHAWLEARRRQDFSIFQPQLERLVRAQVEKADALGWQERRYDALLDLFEPEMKTAQVEELFTELRERLVPLVTTVSQQVAQVDDGLLRSSYSPRGQWAFVREMLQYIGFDFQKSRVDRSEHPFTIGLAPGDVRITTRIHQHAPGHAIFSTLHEAGHAFYEMGIPQRLTRTPLGQTVSLGIHESQSRLWENLIGRSRSFWYGGLPRLRRHFPEQLGDVSLEDLYRAVNRVEPSLVRTEADEMTYNLHIFLRFELEQAMLHGDLAVADLPGAWDEKMRHYLGCVPSDVAQGVLQDVHWSGDNFGYFPTYALGTLLAVQFFDQMQKDLPGLPDLVAAGEFAPIHEWLGRHVHRWGARYTAPELVRRVTGSQLDAAPFLRYIQRKYGEIYHL